MKEADSAADMEGVLHKKTPTSRARYEVKKIRMNTDTPIISGGDSLLKSPSRSILGINFEAAPVLSPAFRFSQQIPTHILIQRDCRNRRSELRLILLSKRGMPRLQKSTPIIVVTQHFYCENCKKGFHPVNSYHRCLLNLDYTSKNLDHLGI